MIIELSAANPLVKNRLKSLVPRPFVMWELNLANYSIVHGVIWKGNKDFINFFQPIINDTGLKMDLSASKLEQKVEKVLIYIWS